MNAFKDKVAIVTGAASGIGRALCEELSSNGAILVVDQQLPFQPIDAGKAARIILRGVARNKAIVVFPLYGRVVWWLRRLHWSFGNPLDAMTVRDFRKSRAKTETAASV